MSQQQHSRHEGRSTLAAIAAKYASGFGSSATPNPAPAPSRKPSREQVRANRRNAKRSTGPRTDAGKRVAAHNAVTHGVFSKDAVLPGERNSEYIAFRNLLFNSAGMMPQDWLEFSIAEQYVLAKWRIRRMQTVEMLVHHDVATLAAEGQVRETEELELAAAAAAAKEEEEEEEEYDEEDARRRAWVRSLLPPEHLRALEADAAAEEDTPQRRLERRQREVEVARQQAMPIHATMAAALSMATHQRGEGASEGVDAFERVGRTIYRLELSASRAMRELRQLRKDTGVDVRTLTHCPFIDPVPRDADLPETDEERANREECERLTKSLQLLDEFLDRAKQHADEDDDDEEQDDEDDEEEEDLEEDAQHDVHDEPAHDPQRRGHFSDHVFTQRRAE